MTRKRGITILLVAAICGVALVSGCGGGAGQKPSTGASETTSAPAPDYADTSNWLSQPSSSDASKPVDVFYLYPTIYQQSSPSDPIVGSADNPQMRAGAPAAFSRTATAFSPLANVFAPYYRQAAIQVLAMPLQKQQQIVGGEPTTDAISAFDYYIKHLNKGRPFILAGHSQGSNPLAVRFHACVLVFLNPKVNSQIKKVLNQWGEFLKSQESRYVLNDNPETGWFGRTRWLNPTDDAVIANSCESAPYGIRAEVSSDEITVSVGQHVSKGDQLGTFHFGGSSTA